MNDFMNNPFMQNMQQEANSAVDKLSAAQSKGHTIQAMMDMHKGSGTSIKNDSALMSVGSQVMSIGKQVGMNEKIFDIGNGKKMSANEVLTQMNKLGADFKISAGADIPVVPVRVTGGVGGARETVKNSGAGVEDTVNVAGGSSGTAGTTDAEQVLHNKNITSGQATSDDKSAG